MNAPIEIRGMTWNHPRGQGPIEAATQLWLRDNPDVTVTWDARPLSDFEDQAIASLAADYDLLMIDHPHIGSAVGQGLLKPVSEWADTDFLLDHWRNSTGPSVDSYTQDDRLWALAVDAASQVGAYRGDLLEAVGAPVPSTWDQVVDIAKATSGSPAQILLPLNPNHAWCTLLSIAHAEAGKGFWGNSGLQFEILCDALGFLSALTLEIDPRSANVDPIAAGVMATTSDTIIGIPLAFGYVTFARAPSTAKRHLTFANSPRGAAGHGSVLGGVGLALSARSNAQDWAASLARLIASPEFQRGGYVTAGGQPGHRTAWLDPQVNQGANGFFSATLDSLDSAFIRPRFAGAEQMHRACADILHGWLWNRRTTVTECAKELVALIPDIDPNQEKA